MHKDDQNVWGGGTVGEQAKGLGVGWVTLHYTTNFSIEDEILLVAVCYRNYGKLQEKFRLLALYGLQF